MTDPSTLEAFASTIIRFEHDTGIWQVAPNDEGSDALVGIGSPAYVISPVYSHDTAAMSDYGCTGSDGPVQLRRHLDLETRLLAVSDVVCSAVGFAADLSYGEQSFAVWDITRDEAVEVGRLFQQLAVFELDGRWVRVIDCTTGGVLSERAFTLTQLGFQPCAMDDPCNPDLGADPCAPPAASGTAASADAKAEWIRNWRWRYAMVGCDICDGCIGQQAH